MEWNKIEKDWKKQLDEQSIAPSAAAWDKLSQQLDKREKKKKGSVITTWIGIAACLVVGGLVGLLLLKTEKSISPNSIEFFPTEQQLVVEETNRQEIVEKEEDIVFDSKGREVKNGVREKVTHNQVAQVNNTIHIVPEYTREKIDTLIIDEIWVKKTPPKVVVDSNDLLKQVEGEIEVEYRDTKLKKIIDTTKKAVVDLSDSRYEK